MNAPFVSVAADIIFCDYYCECLVSVFGNDISYKPACCLRFLWYDCFHLLTAVASKQQQKKLYASGMCTKDVGVIHLTAFSSNSSDLCIFSN